MAISMLRFLGKSKNKESGFQKSAEGASCSLHTFNYKRSPTGNIENALIVLCCHIHLNLLAVGSHQGILSVCLYQANLKWFDTLLL